MRGLSAKLTEGEKYHIGVASPILSEGDVMGCVIILLTQTDLPLTEPEQKLVQTVSGFLGKQMESEIPKITLLFWHRTACCSFGSKKSRISLPFRSDDVHTQTVPICSR